MNYGSSFTVRLALVVDVCATKLPIRTIAILDASPFYAATTGSPGVNFTAGTSPMDCGSATADGSFVLGSSSDGRNVGSITSSTWTDCTALDGALNMAVTQNSTWTLHVGDTNNSTGVTPVTITDVNAHVVDTTYGGAVCDFVVSGSVDGYVQESDQTLHITLPTGVPMPPATTAAGLTLSTVTNTCLGSIAQGQSATFLGVYQVGALAAPHASLNVDIAQP